MIRNCLILGLALLLPAGCAIPCTGPLYGLDRCSSPADRSSPASRAGLAAPASGDGSAPATRELSPPAGPARKARPRRNDPPAQLDMAEATRRLNAYRTRHGLPPLRHNAQLDRVARIHALDLARHDRVSHIGSDGSDPSQRATRLGYSWSVFGENISAGRLAIAEIIRAWHNSPPHRRNLQLAAATEFGLAVAYDPRSTYSNTWVLVVGAPRKASPLQMRMGN